MQRNTERRSKLKQAACVCTLAAMIILLTGCGTSSVFYGSRVSNASEFQMEYSVLNREETAELVLQAGEQLRVTLSHTEGTVDVTVGMEGQGLIYRGRGQQNAEFVLEIAETGNYHISVWGHQAKGSISFTRIPGKMK